MAHGYLQQFARDRAEVYSAGVETHGLNPKAVLVMAEDGIDISHHTSNLVDEYARLSVDYVITVCDSASERCPVWIGQTHRTHHNFTDPSKATGTPNEIVTLYRRVRDEIKTFSQHFINEHIA
ncbi:MAG: arsC [Spirosoma sp.]|nr:arsC [Spirosoma sp.]